LLMIILLASKRIPFGLGRILASIILQ
jgi:hypothetical protein